MTTTISSNEKNQLFAQAPALFTRARELGLISVRAGERDSTLAPKSAPKPEKAWCTKDSPRLFSLAQLVPVVALVFDIPVWKLMSLDRTEPVSMARNCGYKVAREGGHQWEEAGAAFDRSSINTACSGAEHFEDRMTNDPVLRDRYKAVLALMKGGS
jgi:hypothetical protein